METSRPVGVAKGLNYSAGSGDGEQEGGFQRYLGGGTSKTMFLA